jgi:two-component system NtrC family sensor kinase
MKEYYLPLFWKFSIAIITIVMIFGTINIIMILSIIEETADNEFINNSELISDHFFVQADRIIRSNGTDKLSEFVNTTYKDNQNIAFIIVENLSNGSVVKSANNNKYFDMYSNNRFAKLSSNIYKIMDNGSKIYIIRRDITEGSDYRILIGLFQSSNPDITGEILFPIISMIAIFLLIGIAGALFFSSLITNPIRQIISMAEDAKFKAIPENRGALLSLHNRISPYLRKYFVINDELDTLLKKFYTMVARLDDAYKEKDRSYAKLMQAEKLASIGTLTAGIAHEINNPIAGIQNCVRRIEKNPDNNEQNQIYLEMMSEAIDKTQLVLKRLLDYSRSPNILYQNVNIYEVIKKSSMLISYKLEKFHISLVNKVSKNLPNINGNFNQLEQVFINLFLNGIDAIESRNQIERGFPLLIEISAFDSGKVLIIRVTDHGIGISEENIEKVFDPFFTTKETGKGTGLGLFVCYNIIKSHNGNIKIESEYGKYTTFIIELPIIE